MQYVKIGGKLGVEALDFVLLFAHEIDNVGEPSLSFEGVLERQDKCLLEHLDELQVMKNTLKG